MALGGSIGSAIRYLMTVYIERVIQHHFPLATFLVNIIGCFAMGLIVGLLEQQELMNSNIKWLLVSGLCGGFTTFSAFGYENIKLIENGNFELAMLYTCGSIMLGIFFVWLGLLIAK